MAGTAARDEERQRLCDFIREHREEVLAAWEAEIRAFSPAKRMSEARLRDHLPQLLDEIARVTQSAHEGGAVPMGDSPEVHALDRLDEGFDLSVVAREYSYLRRAVLRLYARGTDLPREQIALTEIRRFDFAIDEAVNVAIERFARARQRTLEALDRIAAVALEAGEVASLLPSLLRVMLETAPAVDSVVLLMRDGDVLRLRAAVGLLEGHDIGFTLPVGKGFAGTIAATKRPIALNDAGTDTLVISEYIHKRKIRALYGVPLLHDGEVIGVAHMGSATAWDFSEEDKLLFRTMSHRAASILLRAEMSQRERDLRSQAQRSAAQLQALIDAAPTPIAFLDRDLKYVRVNKAVTQMSGHSTQEHLGHAPWRQYPAVMAALEDIVGGGPPRTFELGDEGHQFLFNLFPVDTDGGLPGVGGIVTDITDRKHTETLLAASERKFATMFAAAPFAMSLMRLPGGTFADVNPAFLSLFGYSREELLGRTSVDVGLVLDPESRARAYEQLEREGFSRDVEIRAKTKAGEVRIVSHNLDMVELNGDAYVLATFIDVTEQRAAQEALRRAEERLRLAIEATDLGTWDWNIATGEVHWSPENRKILGIPSDVKPAPWHTWERVHPADQPRLKAAVERALDPDGDRRYEIEYRVQRPDGERRWVSCRGRAFFDEGRRPVRLLGTTLDISGPKAAEEKLQRSVEFRERLIGIVSHDLRSPLAAISVSAQQLVARPSTPPWVSSLGVRVRRSADRMTRMISDLLDFTRIEATGGLPIDPRRVDLKATLEDVLEEVESASPGRVQATVPEGAVTGEWDPDRLAQVITNLVKNALEHGDPHAPVSVSLRDAPEEVELSVRNRGPPIPAEALPTIFDPFRRVDTREKKRGLGLGLHIVLEAVKAHGGTVGVSSNSEEGTAFTVRLPKVPHERRRY